MLSFDLDAGRRFNYRVVGVFIHDGHVLLHRAATDTFWSLPGGRGEFLEPSGATLRREMQEELGQEITVGPLLWVVENFFRLDSRQYHEIALYYQTAFVNQAMYGKDQTWHGSEEGADLTFRWFPIAALPELLIYPAFLRQGLARLPEAPQHLVIDDVG